MERLERRLVLAAVNGRPFIELGPSDNVALDQPRVQVEFINAGNAPIGPDIFNSWLLDTGANTILAFKTAIDDMNANPPGYETEGTFAEIGVGGVQSFDISKAYRMDFAGTSGERKSLPGTRIISDPTRDVSQFGPFGIVGMPAMTERVTTLDFSVWLTPDNFLMKTEFPDTVPAGTGSRYTVSVDNRVFFEPDGQVTSGVHPPAWADIPFFDVDVLNGDKRSGGNFLFDTGAQVSIISSRIAFELGLDSNGDGNLDDLDAAFARYETVGGVGGTKDAPVFIIDETHVPTDQGVDLVWTSLLWLVLDIYPTIDGVFGFDNMTSGWIESFFGGTGEAGYVLQSHLDFRGWETTGAGKIHFDINPDLDAVQDPNGPGAIVIQSGGVTTVSEAGYRDDYTIALNRAPTADVVVSLVPQTGKLRAHPAGDPTATSIRFTPADWNVPRTVVVTAIDDTVEQSLHRASIRHVSASADPGYDGVGMPRVIVNIVDDDFAAALIMPTDGETRVTEGGPSDTYQLVLTTPPTTTVDIVLEHGAGQVTALATNGETFLRFTPSNWNVPQTVVVTAVNDTLVEGPHRAYVTHRIVTSDEEYVQAYILQETVFIVDNDVATPLPTLTVTSAAVSAAEGTSVTNSGTWGHQQAGTAVTLAASAGTITKNADGTWSWSLAVADQAPATTVTITATDGAGRSATATFTYASTNAAPGLSVASAAVSGAVLSTVANSGTWSDVAADTVTLSASLGAVTKNGDGTWSWSLTPSSKLTDQPVTITASDEDGGTSTVTFTVTAKVAVTGEQIFYKGSSFAGSGVDAALDPVKVVARPGAA
ncbi:MAG: Ig-like domain-containing protein, partial [Planctomycetaceae bacterium]